MCPVKQYQQFYGSYMKITLEFQKTRIFIPYANSELPIINYLQKLAGGILLTVSIEYVQNDNITIGDDYHYIMECEHFSNFRNRFIVTNLRERSNILKLKKIMSGYQKQNLEKLCKFIRNINMSFVLQAVSHPCLCCIHITVYMFISILYLLYVYLCLLCTVLYGL